MLKAVFTDFYGTLVHEDGDIVKQICNEIFITGNAVDRTQIGSYWQHEFQKLTRNAFGENFMTQREIELQSLIKTTEKFQSSANAEELSEMLFTHWVRPPSFEDARDFFEHSPLPVYIVSNIDRADLLKAIEFNGFAPAGIFTSEDAKAYKPRREIFELALKSIGINAHEAVHIGDSFSSDVKGALAAGINAVWLNRSKREVPKGIAAAENLTEFWNTRFFK
ncbi:MAG: HAD family hydrolase [Oscillospiraceae bacterium]|nr:HAD family hydrolase [Oscillospiraceae bacterium]